MCPRQGKGKDGRGERQGCWLWDTPRCRRHLAPGLTGASPNPGQAAAAPGGSRPEGPGGGAGASTASERGQGPGLRFGSPGCPGEGAGAAPGGQAGAWLSPRPRSGRAQPSPGGVVPAGRDPPLQGEGGRGPHPAAQCGAGVCWMSPTRQGLPFIFVWKTDIHTGRWQCPSPCPLHPHSNPQAPPTL